MSDDTSIIRKNMHNTEQYELNVKVTTKARELQPDNGWFHIDRHLQTAMLIVPHQDDETIIAASTIKILNDSGCKVFCVFTTNGDYIYPAAIRQREAISALKSAGIPRQQIIFLGYGDQYCGKVHLYNAASDKTVFESVNGCRKCYSTKYAADFRFSEESYHSSYTRKNYEQDLKNVLLRYKPDIIFAVDYDWHPDHRATSLTFEKVLGEIIREDAFYQPDVYKTFEYSLNWEVTPYLGLMQMCSTRKPSRNVLIQQCGEQDLPQYCWEDRSRFPVIPEMTAWRLCQNLRYKMLSKHRTQLAKFNAYSVIRNDEVFWHRRTDSLSYRAKVTVSSGDKEYLNDYKLKDCRNINLRNDSLEIAGSGVWHPDENDPEKTASLIFDNPHSLEQISLYENSSRNSHILDGVLEFDTGFTCHTGELRPNGAETRITFPVQLAKRVTFRILKAVGPAYGLTELEAYAPKDERRQIDFIKIEVDDDFVSTLFLPDNQEICRYRIAQFDKYGTPVNISIKYDFLILAPEGDVMEIKSRCFYFPLKFKSCCLRVTSKDNPALYDQIAIIRQAGIIKLLHILSYGFEKAIFQTEYFFDRVINKVYRTVIQRIQKIKKTRISTKQIRT